MDILNDIINKLNNKYSGKLNCQQQKADLFVYVNGVEESIKEITTQKIYFNNSECDVDLIDADIHSLVYINHILDL